MSEQQEQQEPQFGIEKIYLKDLSLEIPNAPQVFLEQENPQIEINMHSGAGPLAQEGLFEAVLTVTVTAKAKDKTVFLVEVAQAGIFRILHLPPAELDAVLGVLCPNTLMPYVREAVSSLMARAGFPPVMLQHINFEATYQERLRQLAQEQAAQAGAPN